MAIIVGDVTGLQQRHQPLNIPHLVKKIKGFPLKIKWLQNTATYQKLRGGVPSTPPPPPYTPLPLYLNLDVRPRVNLQTQAFKPTWSTINVCVVYFSFLLSLSPTRDKTFLIINALFTRVVDCNVFRRCIHY